MEETPETQQTVNMFLFGFHLLKDNTLLQHNDDKDGDDADNKKYEQVEILLEFCCFFRYNFLYFESYFLAAKATCWGKVVNTH